MELVQHNIDNKAFLSKFAWHLSLSSFDFHFKNSSPSLKLCFCGTLSTILAVPIIERLCNTGLSLSPDCMCLSQPNFFGLCWRHLHFRHDKWAIIPYIAVQEEITESNGEIPCTVCWFTVQSRQMFTFEGAAWISIWIKSQSDLNVWRSAQYHTVTTITDIYSKRPTRWYVMGGGGYGVFLEKKIIEQIVMKK